jgi:hypothetical protein
VTGEPPIARWAVGGVGGDVTGEPPIAPLLGGARSGSGAGC